jgi:hypothetical protein
MSWTAEHVQEFELWTGCHLQFAAKDLLGPRLLVETYKSWEITVYPVTTVERHHSRICFTTFHDRRRARRLCSMYCWHSASIDDICETKRAVKPEKIPVTKRPRQTPYRPRGHQDRKVLLYICESRKRAYTTYTYWPTE